MVVDKEFNAAVESGFLELASHIHSWYITVEASAANVIGMIGSDHQVDGAASNDQPEEKIFHLDDLAASLPDRTKTADETLGCVRKAGNRSILKAYSLPPILKANTSHPSPARHVSWDPSTDGRPDYTSCSKPGSKSFKRQEVNPATKMSANISLVTRILQGPKLKSKTSYLSFLIK